MADRGLRLEGWGTTERGYPYFRFRAVRGNVREVVLYITTDRPAKVMFAYSIWEASTHTLTSYHGPYGDPERDELGEMEGT
jgi:hypothetical protein